MCLQTSSFLTRETIDLSFDHYDQGVCDGSLPTTPEALMEETLLEIQTRTVPQ